MADFNQMGGVPDFYAQLLNSARQGLVRLPDGSYAPAPQMGQPTSVQDLYSGIVPPTSYATTAAEQRQARPQPPAPPNDNAASWRTGQGRVYDPSWWPQTTGRIETAANVPQIPGPSGYTNFNKNPDRLMSGTGLAFAGEEAAPPGLAAITAATSLPQLPASWWNKLGKRSPLVWEDVQPSGPGNGGDPWGNMRLGGKVQNAPGMVTGARSGAVPSAPQADPGGLLGMLFGGGQGGFSLPQLPAARPTDPAGFAADVTRQSNMPGVEQFTGKVEQGQAGQNRYGSTAHTELLKLFG